MFFAWPQARFGTPTWKEDILRKTPRHHRFLVPAASLAFLLLASAGSAGPTAKSGLERPAELEVRVEQIVKLRPQADAEVVIPDFRAIFLSDGSVSIRAKGTADANAEPQGYDFEVDLVNGTYTTRRLDRQEIAERDLLQQELLKDQLSGEEPLESTTKAITPGTWFARARVQTKDPVNVLLAETMTSLTWTVSSTGTVTGVSPSTDRCWAANPSSLGTHWSVSSCSYGALYVSAGRVCNDNTGNYINYDFGLPAYSTTASHYVYVCGRNDATYNYDYTANHGGEFYFLLTGTLILG